MSRKDHEVEFVNHVDNPTIKTIPAPREMVRLVRFDGGRSGLLTDADSVVDLGHRLAVLSDAPNASWVPIIERWSEVSPALEEILAAPTDAIALDSVTLEAPLPELASRAFALGGNFAAHVTGADQGIEISDSVREAMSGQSPPWGFFVIPGTTVGHGHLVSPPPGTRKLDYEGEVAAVIASPPSKDAPARFWGYTAWSDFSIRDAAFGLSKVDHGPLTWSLQKNFQTGNACGPCLVVGDRNPGTVGLTCRVNGETRQQASLNDMTFRFEDVARYLQGYLDLRPGDIIVSGCPAGTAMESGIDGPFLDDGDVVEVEVDDVGVLRNAVSMIR